MNYKALFSDVDGTLVPVGPHTKPTPHVIEAIKKAQEKGAAVCLVSGRPIKWMTDIIDVLSITSPCIINGGTQIIDPTTQRILWEQPMDKRDVQNIWEIIRENNYNSLMNDDGIEYENQPERPYANPIAMQIQHLEQSIADSLIQELNQSPTIVAHKIFSWEKGKFDIYITHKEATKQHAAQELIKLLHLTPEEVIGIGDGNNDMPLLSACGLKVAMGNASDELKAYATYIAPSLDDDGVADVIEKFILSS